MRGSQIPLPLAIDLANLEVDIIADERNGHTGSAFLVCLNLVLKWGRNDGIVEFEEFRQAAFQSIWGAPIVVKNYNQYTQTHRDRHTQISFKVFDLITRIFGFGSLIQYHFLFALHEYIKS